MGIYWTLADALWAFHITYVVVLGFGTILAAFGVMRRFRRLSLLLFANLALGLSWQVLPGCPLTVWEKWLRRHVEPGWTPGTPLPEKIAERITGMDLSPEIFFGIGAGWIALFLFALWKTFFAGRGRVPSKERQDAAPAALRKA